MRKREAGHGRAGKADDGMARLGGATMGRRSEARLVVGVVRDGRKGEIWIGVTGSRRGRQRKTG